MWILPCYLLLSVTVSGLKLQRSSEDIPEVHLNLLHLLDPSGFSVTWDPIKTRNESNTILGIKVKAWKTPCVVKTVYKVSDRLTKIVKLEPQ
ncbi:jg22126, partial [Pararge aegeria aegeria]